VLVDDGSSVPKAEEVAKKLCSEKNILGIIGHYSSDTSLAAAKIYNDHGLPLLSPIASNPQLTGSGLPNVFRYTNRDDRTAQAISSHLHKVLDKKTAVVIRSNTAYGHSMSGQFEKAFSEEGGHILSTFTIDEGNTDLSPLAASLSKETDLFFYGGTFEGAYLLKALRANGYTQLMATGDGCWDKINFLDIAGPAAGTGEGVLVLSASSAIGEVPGSTEFAKRYEKLYGPVINYALNAYDATCILVKAIEETTQTSPPNKEMVIRSIKDIRFTGTANPNPVTWDDKGDNTGAITRLYTVSDGHFVPVEKTLPRPA
jgi:branched-chain amino acid transport system substrate-binding protein